MQGVLSLLIYRWFWARSRFHGIVYPLMIGKSYIKIVRSQMCLNIIMLSQSQFSASGVIGALMYPKSIIISSSYILVRSEYDKGNAVDSSERNREEKES